MIHTFAVISEQNVDGFIKAKNFVTISRNCVRLHPAKSLNFAT